MKKLKYAWSGIYYHKKMGRMIFLFFSIFLLLSIFLESLLQQQKFTLTEINQRWKTLATFFTILPQTYQEISVANGNLVMTYHILQFILLLICSLTFGLLTFLSAKHRQTEIRSMHHLGLRNSQIAYQFLLEMLLPLFASLLLIFACLVLFQTPYTKAVYQTNDHYFSEKLSGKNSFSLAQDKNKEATNPNSNATKKQTFLPFSKDSLFEITYENTNNDVQLYQNFMKSFAQLFAVIFVTASLVFYFYSFYLYRHLY